MAWGTVKNVQVGTHGWCAFCYSGDLQACEEIKAAPSAGKNLYIEHLFISCVSAIDITIGEDENAGAVKTPYTTFEFVATSGAPIDIHFTRPIKVTTNEAFTADATGEGKVTIIASGYTK